MPHSRHYQALIHARLARKFKRSVDQLARHGVALYVYARRRAAIASGLAARPSAATLERVARSRAMA